MVKKQIFKIKIGKKEIGEGVGKMIDINNLKNQRIELSAYDLIIIGYELGRLKKKKKRC